MKKYIPLTILILIVIFTRIAFIFLPGFKIDVDDWFSWSNRLIEVGFSRFYNPQIFSDYTPGYLYVLALLGWIKNLLFLDDKTFYVLLKIPAILADVILGLLIYKELTKITSTFYSTTATLLVVLNPAFIFNSAIWGQIDSIPTLLMFASVLYFKNKRIIFSSLILGLSFLIKPQSFVLFPIFILFLVNNFSLRNCLKIILPFFLTITLLSFPFFPDTPLTGVWLLIQKSANQYPFNSLFAYNLWGIFGFWTPDDIFKYWGYLLLISFFMILGFFYIRSRLSISSLATLLALSFFFLSTRIHERYLYPGLFFLILTATVYKNKLVLIFSLILSMLHFLNLYYVYIYYNEIYLKLPKLLYNPYLYNFLDTNSKTLSFVSTIIFILVSINLLKVNHVNKKN